MAKTAFDDGTPGSGIKGTQVTSVFLNKINSHHHTGLDVDGDGALPYALDTGSVNAIVIALTPALTAYVVGMPVYFKANNTSTEPVTININGLGVQPMIRNDFGLFLPGDIVAGNMYEVIWNGTEFQLINPTNNSLTARGYFAGGADGSLSAAIDGIKFSDETAINPAATLADGARQGLAGVNSVKRGYFGGGFTTAVVDVIDGMQFSDETAINPAAVLADGARTWLSGMNSRLKGYFAGGYNVGSYLAYIDGLLFSDETAISIAAVLADGARRASAGVSSLVKGYIGGGFNGSARAYIDGVLFSDDSAINPSATLADGARQDLAGVNSPIRGYFGGGVGSVNVIDGIQFSDEAAINPSAVLATGRQFLAGANSAARGYFASTSIDGIQFSDETAINPAATLADGDRSQLTGVQSGGMP